MQPQIDQFRHHLAAFDMPEEAKAEVIRAVYAFMKGMHDILIGADATQIAVGMNSDDAGIRAGSTLEWHDPPTLTFNDAAWEIAARKTTS